MPWCACNTTSHRMIRINKVQCLVCYRIKLPSLITSIIIRENNAQTRVQQPNVTWQDWLKWIWCQMSRRIVCIPLVLIILFLVSQFGIDEKINMFPVIETVKNYSKPPELSNEPIFIRSAFLVSDTEIRLTILKHHRNNRPIYYRYGSLNGEVDVTCNLPKCIDAFSPTCTIGKRT